jgi:hypothetical protein
VELFFLAGLAEDEALVVSEAFFFVVVEVALVPDFFSPVVVFLPVVELVVELVDDDVSLFLAQETKKASATISVVKAKMVFFIRFCKGR